MIVLEHISTLLCSADAEARRRANEYLVKWQQSVEAWQEAHALIAGNYPVEAKLIGAQTLRTKLMYDFYQLPAESVEQLCEILMSYLADPNLPRNISTTLCLAVCDLATQAAEVWASPLEYFIACYSRGALPVRTLLLLIQFLAEEAANTRVVVPPDVRNRVKQNLKRDYSNLLEFLVNLRASGNDVEITSAIFRCWHSWRRLDNFAANGQACNMFINDCLLVVSRPNARGEHGIDDETYEAAMDCMIDCLYEVADLTQQIKEKAEASSTDVEYFKQAKNDLQHVVRAAFDLCVTDEFNGFLVEAFRTNDRMMLGCFSNLVIALIYALDLKLIDEHPQVSRLLNLVTRFIELPYCIVFPRLSTDDEPNTINCFSKHYNRLAVRIQALQLLANCDPAEFCSIDEEVVAYTKRSVSVLLSVLQGESPNCQTARDVGKQLLEIVIFVATRPGCVGKADNVEYENYVAEVYDVIPYLTRLLQTDEVFETVKEHTVDNGNFAASHYGLESCFRALGATISALDMKSASQKNVAAIASVIEGVDKLLHDRMPTELREWYCWEAAIRFLKNARRVIMLDKTEVLAQKVTGLLCGAYLVALGSNTPLAAQIEESVVSSLSEVCSHLRLGRLRNWEPILQNLGLCIQRAEQEQTFALMLIEGTGNAISDLPPETVAVIIQQLSHAWFQQLEAVARNEVTLDAVEVSKLTTKISTLLRSIRMKNILHALIKEKIVPLMCLLLEKYHQQPNTVECICRCLKHAAKSIGREFAPFVHQVVQTVGKVANECIWSTYLYVVEWLYSVLPPNQPEQEEVKQLYSALTKITLGVLAKKDVPDEMREDPEQLIEDFFGLQTRFVKNSPECFDSEAVFREIAATSIACFNMRQPHWIFEFWITLVETEVLLKKFDKVAMDYLPKCVEQSFQLLGSGCRASVEHCVEDFIESLVRLIGNDVAGWLQMGLEKLPTAVLPNPRQKNIMLQALLSKTSHKAVYELHKLCCQVVMRNRTNLT
ncbi:hypothetical protein, conserved [Babesia bigemina]|uniref:Exportin-1/Importin-beta-like domain-containing protein n=1 Tax=Babesia bigemina TaxID=5866 RepID=A0A061CZP2_BABBI|nr:hypothetical protein, conserved [Babesia bigemina]CDR94091.1 hypothetical protein, conserved [Babesia bigemina]|eukprot:XP_012766277.1 hypothetical protein, conserved [Babesia bigemina]